MRFVSLALFIAALVSGAPVLADVSVPRLFADHMVLQRNKPVPVWGWADAGEKVTVELVMPGKKSMVKTVKADKAGNWKLALDQMEAGGPYTMAVKGKKNTLTFQDVMVGEVWLCSGQSNMGWSVAMSENAEKEKNEANYPLIRHFHVPLKMAVAPEKTLSGGEWQVASPATVGDFTAVGYFFGRELFRELNVPIGLINSSWGGTQVESWISKESMASFEEFREAVNQLPASMDELNERRKKIVEERVIATQGNFPAAGEIASFSSAEYDDSGWKTMKLPVFFDLQLLPGFDGEIWFRKAINLPADRAGKASVLELGVIDDMDVTYVNGVKVGATEGKSGALRRYRIPAEVLKAGKNVISVKVIDKAGFGGFAGKPEQMVLYQDDFQERLDTEWKYKAASLIDNKQFAGPNHAGTLLYNAMIAPLVPYAIKGAIWYQGESNAPRAYQYRKSFPLMITDWRKQWNEDFPFLFVQLASFNAANGDSEKGSTWAELREAQTMTLALPHTGMAVTTDIGESKDIHPRNKQDVGRRLALNAFQKVYGKNIVYTGPMYKSMQREGNAIAVTFDHTGGGLIVKDKYGYLKGFEIAGADKKWHWAKAEINGDKVVVWSDEVPEPVAVHYGWADDNIEGNLFNKEGLPAVPFRTDNWKGITEENRFK